MGSDALESLNVRLNWRRSNLTTKESTTLTDCVFEDASGERSGLRGGHSFAPRCRLGGRANHPTLDRYLPDGSEGKETFGRPRFKRLFSSAAQRKLRIFASFLKSALGIPVDFSMDPLTVVAKGAAVFAGTQKLDPKLLRRAKVGEYQVELLKSNKNVGHEIDPLAGGKVLNPDGASVEGFTIELVNPKSQWRSGKVTLRADGAFLINLLAEKGERNVFNIELRDASGTMQKAVPDHMVYTVGAVVEEQPLDQFDGRGSRNKRSRVVLQKGALAYRKRRSIPNAFRRLTRSKLAKKEWRSEFRLSREKMKQLTVTGLSGRSISPQR